MSPRVKELSWSLSRARTFEECPRRLYLHSYLSQAGYSPDAPEEARRALEMRSIKSLDMWVGEIVHGTIQWALEQAREGSIPTAQDARSETRRRLSEGWQRSVKQLWRSNNADEYPNLFDHYYGISVGDATIERIKNKAFTSIGNFMDSYLLRRIATTPVDRWLPIDRFASFRLDGLLMYVKFDFALKEGKRLIVYDWKTGVPSSDERRQLACYAMYTSAKWAVPVANIAVCPVHLQPEFDAEEYTVADEDVDDAKTYIKQSFQGMVKCLRNPARNIAVMDDFPATGNLLRCVRCSFKGICEQGKVASGDLDDYPLVEEWDV